MLSLRPLGSTVITRFAATMGRSDSRAGAPADYLFSTSVDLPSSPSACTGLSCSCMNCPTAPPSLTPESLPPVCEHCLGVSAGFAISERLATLSLLNEARFGSLALRLGRSLRRALAGGIAPARYRLRFMFNVQFTWQAPFILLVHSGFP